MADLTLAITGAASVSGTGLLGAPGIVALTLPTPQLQVSDLRPAVRVALPTPSLVATGSSGITGTVALTLPMPQLSLTIQGRTGITGQVRQDLPTPTLVATGVVGVVGSVVLTLPTPTIQASGPNAARLTLPAPTLSASGTTGAIGTVALTLAVPRAVSAGSSAVVGAVVLQLPVPTLQIAATNGAQGQVALTLSKLALAAQGYTGVRGTVTLTLPVMRLDVEGYTPVTGAVRLVLPAMQLVATGRSPIAAGASQPVTLAMQTEALSLSTYSNYPFNSFAQFNGMFLGASDAGVFALTGATDAGVPIQAAARVGMTDFGTSHLKRVDRVYVGYRTDGNLVLRIFTDEVTQRDYLLTNSQRAGLHGNHARLGKGLLARYWQFEVRNQAGCDFSLDCIELKPTKLPRRIGGDDA